jgi:hypothetical protein
MPKAVDKVIMDYQAKIAGRNKALARSSKGNKHHTFDM